MMIIETDIVRIYLILGEYEPLELDRSQVTLNISFLKSNTNLPNMSIDQSQLSSARSRLNTENIKMDMRAFEGEIHPRSNKVSRHYSKNASIVVPTLIEIKENTLENMDFSPEKQMIDSEEGRSYVSRNGTIRFTTRKLSSRRTALDILTDQARKQRVEYDSNKEI